MRLFDNNKFFGQAFIASVTFFELHVISCAVYAETIVELVNCDFDAGGRTDWAGEPVGWYSRLYHKVGTNGNYGEPVLDYGSGNFDGLKAEGSYYKQSLSGVDADVSGSYAISYYSGIRYHSSYNNPAYSTSREVTNEGLIFQAGGRYQVSIVYFNEIGENFDGYHSECWGLYRSAADPDTVTEDFTAAGKTYNGWSAEDFLENPVP